jgi:hypothetical protein
MLAGLSGADARPPLPYGPETCLEGFVWREAVPVDHVCVTSESRALVAQENATALTRRAQAGGPYGPNTCREGFVWREAINGDVVCVTPERRAAVAEENRLGRGRRAMH